MTLPVSLTLPAGDSAPVTLTVTIPESALDGDADTAHLLAISQGDTAKRMSFQVTTTAYDYDVRLIASPDHKLGFPGETVTYTVLVYNNGAYSDSYDLSVDPGVWQISPILTSVGPIDPGESLPLTVGVLIPDGEPSVNQDSVTITAVSQARPVHTDSVILVTSFERLFIPLILK